MGGTIGKDTIQQWWGNRVYKETLDWKSSPYRPLSPDETFGCVLSLFLPRALESDAEGLLTSLQASTVVALAEDVRLCTAIYCIFRNI
jgi:hypothetical protein